MEGIGSRTGRPSSRYGSAPVFTGPVRRWQKQWVHVSSSSSSSVSYNHNNSSTSTGNNHNNNNDVSAVRIRRWTPISSAPSGGDAESEAEERPRRKLRYAPIVVLDGKKKESEKSDVDVKEASKTGQATIQGTLENDDEEKKSLDDVPSEKDQASQKSASATEDLNNQPMDLDISGDDEDCDLGGANKVSDWVKAAQRGFAS